MESQSGDRVVVIGGGIFGVTAALELARRGFQVMMLDMGEVPYTQAASTDISKVIRMDYGDDEFYMSLMEEALEGWVRWNEEWDPPLYHPWGVLLLAAEQMEPGGFEYESYQLLLERGHSPERMGTDRLAERFPRWRRGTYQDGYFNPLGGWAESGRVVKTLYRLAGERGVQRVEGVRVVGLLTDQGRVRGVEAAGGLTWEADWVVVAAGAWTPKLLPHLGPVMWPVAQPVMHFRAAHPEQFRPPTFTVWTADVAETGWYGFPALEDGTLKIANHGPGWKVDPDAPRELPRQVEGEFRAFLRSRLPELAEAPILDRRMCLYCDTWDGDLWIGRDPQLEGLVVAAGGSGHGFKFAPILGSITADALQGIVTSATRRFGWRARGEIHTEQARHS